MLGTTDRRRLGNGALIALFDAGVVVAAVCAALLLQQGGPDSWVSLAGTHGGPLAAAVFFINYATGMRWSHEAEATYLEGLHPTPNLMGVDSTERAFIEMADRQVELYLCATVANCIRHTHPGLAVLEGRQFADFGQAQGARVLEVARWYDAHLGTHEFVAAQRFTIADITLLCALDFAKGLMKFKPAEQGLPQLQAWRDRMAARPSAAQ